MSAPFVTQLRARRGLLQLAPAGTPALTVRVEVPEVWDTVAAVVAPAESVRALKAAALNTIYPDGTDAGAWVMKLRGFEVLDEAQSLSSVGAEDGSIFLLTHRRRRPVR